MNLVEAMMDDYCIVNRIKDTDGEGGFKVRWEDGAEFKAAVVQDTTLQAKIAEKEGVTSTYTVTTIRDVALDFHDVIKRKKDGMIFRITSEAGMKMSPRVSGLDMAQVSAERWELTT